VILAEEAALLVLFVALIVSAGINVWLYLRVRRLQTELDEQHYDGGQR
jgi:cell division protein FtsL